MKVTIYDIAKEAGVSIATVSKVINRGGRISEKTRNKVIKIMDELNYQPSVVASALTGKQTYTLGLLLPDLANPFFAEIARSIEDRAQEMGFNVVICSTDNSLDKEERYISLLKQKSVDGIIIATGVRNDALLKELVRQKLPVALIARDMPAVAVDIVLVDDFQGGYLATSYLIQNGHKQIAVIAEDTEVMSSKERIRGYRHALEEAGIPFNPELVRISDFSVKSGKIAAGELLQGLKACTAVFACNDLLAIGTIQAAREMKLSIPDDLSVVGFDNTILATIVDPPLTTIAQPIQDMGAQVVNMILRHINGGHTMNQRMVLPPELVIRSSVSRPRK
ncbi:LacI family transcriptional regulator [Paenibacillus sp. WQ 127069]|uniref:LacI family transcriptional regulator n=1 Tax=Paenibacillus baimaensis TaxID=2982185 RepID=A0ABT2UKB9_9BACL|nr:LacI family DNA-binding transcriptional regulator [Paenibacillus sp. WQ 127069]MCU6795091.1 LacI family transcriptional regulator [Paenibacillus sp. WQ 127069]